MKKKATFVDPTADQALANLEREERRRSPKVRRPTRQTTITYTVEADGRHRARTSSKEAA